MATRVGASGAGWSGECSEGDLGVRRGRTAGAQARARARPGHGGCVGARLDLEIGEERDGEIYLTGCAREGRSQWRRLEARQCTEAAGVASSPSAAMAVGARGWRESERVRERGAGE